MTPVLLSVTICEPAGAPWITRKFAAVVDEPLPAGAAPTKSVESFGPVPHRAQTNSGRSTKGLRLPW